jgi:hypothetical protein
MDEDCRVAADDPVLEHGGACLRVKNSSCAVNPLRPLASIWRTLRLPGSAQVCIPVWHGDPQLQQMAA